MQSDDCKMQVLFDYLDMQPLRVELCVSISYEAGVHHSIDEMENTRSRWKLNHKNRNCQSHTSGIESLLIQSIVYCCIIDDSQLPSSLLPILVAV